MTHKFLYHVDLTTYIEAHKNWIAVTGRAWQSVAVQFHKEVGITPKQYEEYVETWKLKVSRATLKKLELLASGRIQHWETLFKVIDAREA